MPNTERGGFGFSVNSLLEGGMRQQARGVYLPGQLCYDSFPNGATPAPASGAAANGAFGSDIAVVASTATDMWVYATTIQAVRASTSATTLGVNTKDGTTKVRQSVQAYPGGGFSIQSVNHYVPYFLRTGSALNVAFAENGATDTVNAYVYGMLASTPRYILSPKFYTQSIESVVGLSSNCTISGGTCTSGGGAWTFGTYAQLSASAGPLIITHVLLESLALNASSMRIEFATGAAASEVVWGAFGIPVQSGSASADQDVVLEVALPFPVLVPASTRLAVRVAASVATQGAAGALRTIALPLL